MHSWQKDLWAALAGSDPREMKIVMGGRNVGKSALAQMWNIMEEGPGHMVLTSAEVDGRTWYTVKCNKEVAAWVRQQPGEGTQWDTVIDEQWYIYEKTFDMHEEFYMMLKLRWGC